MNEKIYDLIVAGGGLSGVSASIAAARQGLSVLLVEQSGYFGGAACNNSVNPFVAYWNTDDNGARGSVNAGIFAEIINDLKKIGGLSSDGVVFGEEHLKFVLDGMTEKYGVNVLLHTSVTDAMRNGNKVESVTLFNKGGAYKLGAKYFVDATGDADIVHFAGFGYETNDADRRQPMTLCFNLGGVDCGDLNYFEIRKKVNGLYRKMQAEGKIKNPRENVLIFPSLIPNALHFNTTRVIGKDSLNAVDLSAAEKEAREQMFELYGFLKSNFDMFKNSYIIKSASSIGVRESRRIIGEYTLTESDILDCKKFPDSVARGNYPIDIHSGSGAGTVLKKVKQNDFYTIPLKSLIVKGADNLCVAGRSVSSTHEAQAAVRVMPISCCMGEGAGTAVAVALAGSVSIGDADINEIHALLDKYGALY